MAIQIYARSTCSPSEPRFVSRPGSFGMTSKNANSQESAKHDLFHEDALGIGTPNFGSGMLGATDC